MDTKILFNTHKMKYEAMNQYFNFDIKEEKVFYCCMDMDWLMSKFLYAIDYYNTKDAKLTPEISNDFLSGLLNIIAHYKNYFYNHCDSISFFYLFINKKRYERDPELNNLMKNITKLITIIPRIYICYYENDDQGFFLKYNLVKHILLSKRGSGKRPIFFDFSKCDKNELFYSITKDIYTFRFDNYKIYPYGFNDFYNDFMPKVEIQYLNNILKLMSVFYVLDEIKINKKIRIDDVIYKYVKSHNNDDFTDIKTKIHVIRMFTKIRSLVKKIKSLEYNLNNPMYSHMIQIIMENWKRTIKDNSIYNINEILHIEQDKRINIETLMKY